MESTVLLWSRVGLRSPPGLLSEMFCSPQARILVQKEDAYHLVLLAEESVQFPVGERFYELVTNGKNIAVTKSKHGTSFGLGRTLSGWISAY